MVTTFLPYASFEKSLAVLDDRRLGKQRVETFQILKGIHLLSTGEKYGYQNHPASTMWHGYEKALLHYYNCCIDEWVKRGKNNTMEKAPEQKDIVYPWWFGWNAFHKSHQASLLRKEPEFYGPIFRNIDNFGTEEYLDDYYLDKGYIWPSKVSKDSIYLNKEHLESVFAPISGIKK